MFDLLRFLSGHVFTPSLPKFLFKKIYLHWMKLTFFVLIPEKEKSDWFIRRSFNTSSFIPFLSDVDVAIKINDITSSFTLLNRIRKWQKLNPFVKDILYISFHPLEKSFAYLSWHELEDEYWYDLKQSKKIEIAIAPHVKNRSQCVANWQMAKELIFLYKMLLEKKYNWNAEGNLLRKYEYKRTLEKIERKIFVGPVIKGEEFTDLRLKNIFENLENFFYIALNNLPKILKDQISLQGNYEHYKFFEGRKIISSQFFSAHSLISQNEITFPASLVQYLIATSYVQLSPILTWLLTGEMPLELMKYFLVRLKQDLINSFMKEKNDEDCYYCLRNCQQYLSAIEDGSDPLSFSDPFLWGINSKKRSLWQEFITYRIEQEDKNKRFSRQRLEELYFNYLALLDEEIKLVDNKS